MNLPLLSFEKYKERQQLLAYKKKIINDELQKEIDELAVSRQKEIEMELNALEEFRRLLLKPGEEEEKSSNRIQQLVTQLEDSIKNINRLTRYQNYLELVIELKRHCIKTNQLLKEEDTDRAIEEFGKLKQISIPEEFKCLVSYQRLTVDAIEKGLYESLSEILSKRLVLIDWPKITPNEKISSREMGLLLECFDSFVLLSSTNAAANPYAQAVSVMLRPIRVRFAFHYATDRPTNRLDKPEWYLNHLIEVAESQENLLRNVFELKVEDTSSSSSSLFDTFLIGLVDIAKDHLKSVKERLLSDPVTLMHAVEEILKFIKTIKERFLVKADELANVLLGDEDDLDIWIRAQRLTMESSIGAIFEEYPLVCTALMTESISLIEELITVLHLIPNIQTKVVFLNQVLAPAFELLFDRIDFEIPSFHNTANDIQILTNQANALSVLLTKIKDDWGESLEAIELASDPLFQRLLNHNSSNLTASIFNQTFVSFKELLEKIQTSLFDYVWDSFSQPASSFQRAMHYGVVRNNVLKQGQSIGMHDDLRRALVKLVESCQRILPDLYADVRFRIESRLLYSMSAFLYNQMIMENYFRPEYLDQFLSDYDQIQLTLQQLVPSQQLAMFMIRPADAKTLLALSTEERQHFSTLINEDDLDQVSDFLQKHRISTLSIVECERILENIVT